MSSFAKHDGLYGVQIITGPRSVLLRLEVRAERIEDFEVMAYPSNGLRCNPNTVTVRARVLEGTDEANRQYGASFHPWAARFALDDFGDGCPILHRAAFAIVERLVLCGDNGYDGLA